MQCVPNKRKSSTVNNKSQTKNKNGTMSVLNLLVLSVEMCLLPTHSTFVIYEHLLTLLVYITNTIYLKNFISSFLLLSVVNVS